MDNPIGGMSPNFDIFGIEFTTWWQTLFAGAWAIAIVVAIGFLLFGTLKMANSDSNPHEHAEGRKSAVRAGIALVILVAFSVVVGAIIAIAS